MFGYKRAHGLGEHRGRRKHINHHGFGSGRHEGGIRHHSVWDRCRFQPMDQVDDREPWKIADHSDLAIDVQTCPLCKNHCPMDDPGCKKGEAYFKAMNP